MLHRNELIRKLLQLSYGQISFHDFYHWFMPMSFDTDDDMANRILLILAEHTSGHRTRENVLKELDIMAGHTCE